MTRRLDGKRVVIVLAEGFEDLEFHVPMMRLQEEGAAVTVAGLTTDEVAGKHGLRYAGRDHARRDRRRASTPWSCPAGGRPTSSAATTR